MNNKILIIKNIPREDAGLIRELLEELKIDSDTVELENITALTTPEIYRAVLVLGGPASADDSNPFMLHELELIKRIIEHQVPYMGICLGLQTFVKAMGGKIERCEITEVGFRDPSGDLYKLSLTGEGREDSLFDGLPSSLTVFELHGETVIPAEGMKLLAKGDYCRNQVIKIGKNAYGIQCHFELTRQLLDTWLNEDSDLRKADKAMIISDFEKMSDDYRKTGRRLFTNFLKIAGFKTE